MIPPDPIPVTRQALKILAESLIQVVGGDGKPGAIFGVLHDLLGNVEGKMTLLYVSTKLHFYRLPVTVAISFR